MSDVARSYEALRLVCSRCDKKTRIRHAESSDGERHIVCMNCGEFHERAVDA